MLCNLTLVLRSILADICGAPDLHQPHAVKQQPAQLETVVVTPTNSNSYSGHIRCILLIMSSDFRHLGRSWGIILLGLHRD
jgi:hypothetical protein